MFGSFLAHFWFFFGSFSVHFGFIFGSLLVHISDLSANFYDRKTVIPSCNGPLRGASEHTPQLPESEGCSLVANATIGCETKFRICASLSIPFAIKIPAVIMTNGITNELRARELQEASSTHALISSEVCSLRGCRWISSIFP